ncbi:ABC transporter substrate-binding protein [Streptomyces sp. NPDC056010]|uniref:ABC transporter substrate-binding protein n=1 Tax=Streptomyces sp. NPDC056010 TaxID=3345679 RepID=UPI0035DEE4D1
MTREVWRDTAENEAASAVFHFVQQLIDGYRHNRPVMPLVVLQAADADVPPDVDARVEQIVRQVHRANQPRRVPLRLLDGHGDSPYDAALDMVRTLTEKPWETRGGSQYKPFAFPRSRLLGAIEQATGAVLRDPDPGCSRDQRDERILEELSALRWRAGRRGRGTWWTALRESVRPETFVGAVVIAVLGVLLGEIGWLPTMLVAVGAVLGLAVIRLATTSAPPLLWLRRASRWFATTSSLAAASTGYPSDGWSRLSPSGSWRVIRARAAVVAGRVADAAAGDELSRQFHLELRVQALLEDLRNNYRPHAWDWRRGKRTVPPVVFLPRAVQSNGGVQLINAVNNVRSRRSEVDPLLLLASLPAAEILRHTPPLPPDPPPVHTGAARARYEDWVGHLSVGQSPSGTATPAWVLRLPLSTDQLTHEHAHAQLSTQRVRRTWVWWVMSRTTLAGLMAGALLGTMLVSNHLANRYCHGPLTDVDTDSVRLAGPGGGDKECIGVATSTRVRFAEDNGLELDGAGAGVTFDRIERAVAEENASIEPGDKYVTLIYAGPFTAPSAEGTRKALEELTGVYLYQHHTNTLDFSVKLRVLTANGGQDMLQQIPAVKKIIEVAGRDPSVVGVVGLGRDTTDSPEATALLQRAGLPVVDTTNSGGYLATDYSNYFGLAATDQEQADALGLVAKQVAAGAPGTHKPRALVLSRKLVNNDKDRYTVEQRKVGSAMLAKSGFALSEPVEYDLGRRSSADLDRPVQQICAADPAPDALYFAGRVEDVSNLMSRLAHSCARRPITVFTGDDLTKTRLDASTDTTKNVTLYHTALAPMGRGRADGFYEESHRALGKLLPEGGTLPRLPASKPYEDPLFASGQSVMSYSATAALYDAASHGDAVNSAAETWANLYAVNLRTMPTGTITFRGFIPYEAQAGHGLDVVQITYPDGRSHARVICGRAAGKVALEPPECPLK